MDNKLVYAPVFRGLQEEFKVLRSFDFGDRIYPCVEIIKEVDRMPPKPKENSKAKPKVPKTFEESYLPLIQNISANRVFVDLPVHLKEHNSMKPEVIQFLKSVVAKRDVRTEYIKKFNMFKAKVIPVITSYFARTNEQNTIVLQADELRRDFTALAFRTTVDSLKRDFDQIASVVRTQDYLILDWSDNDIDDPNDYPQVIGKVIQLGCCVVLHRNSIPKDLTYTGLAHGARIDSADNGLLMAYKKFGGSCFSDYCGIKKNNLGKGGTISPGFIFYDAVGNCFYGFKSDKKKLTEFKNTIVPSVISSPATFQMSRDRRGYLNSANLGWSTINGIFEGKENGASAAKFKRIGMEHYLHCVKARIVNGDFETS